MRNKILAIVKMGTAEYAGKGLVLKHMPILKYNQYGDTIIGTDGTFFESYHYEKCGPNWKAFAGREFDLTLVNGTVIHCYGQYWDVITKITKEIMGNEIMSIALSTPNKLSNCYCFLGMYGIIPKVQKLAKKYHGKLYEYHEYESILKEHP